MVKMEVARWNVSLSANPPTLQQPVNKACDTPNAKSAVNTFTDSARTDLDLARAARLKRIQVTIRAIGFYRVYCIHCDYYVTA